MGEESIGISHITPDEAASDEAKELIALLDGHMLEAPKVLGEAVEVYGTHPEVVSGVVDFLQHNQEGLPALAIVRDVFKLGADQKMEFSPKIEEQLKKDPAITRLKDDMTRASAERKPEIRDAIRRLRIVKAAGMIASTNAANFPAA